MGDTKLAKKSLQALAKTIGEIIGEWEEAEGFEVCNLSLNAAGVYIVAVNQAKGLAFDSDSREPLKLDPQTIIE